ncbi:TolB-like protein [Marilutibacter chinensis]|uniref:TolB-like protein n=1 Tax=Marilutibacter chinensis TaxID=2912247 RepID=A0ABS9HUD7_9GAMM|nr:TolB-like protein [Lysobacter chinensis]MCF7221707.1 TolB-like protein [Lysobacter chinensis]
MRIIVACAFSLLPALCAATSTQGLPAVAASGLSEYGIEGMGVVSTRADEGRASVGADGRRIVWAAAGREGGAGGSDLWQATLHDGRWQDPVPLAINSPADDADPAFDPDGRWLYFSSNREGGRGGHDLYRARVLAGGGFGVVEHLGGTLNTSGDERAPMPGPDGNLLLFASDGHGGEGGLDLLSARRDDDDFAEPRALPGTVNTIADETDPAWLADGATLVFSRGNAATSQVRVAHCDGSAYAGDAALELSFNTADARTFAPVPDGHKPGELLVAGTARAPRAGGTDLYRTVSPKAAGRAGCLDEGR